MFLSATPIRIVVRAQGVVYRDYGFMQSYTFPCTVQENCYGLTLRTYRQCPFERCRCSSCTCMIVSQVFIRDPRGGCGFALATFKLENMPRGKEGILGDA